MSGRTIDQHTVATPVLSGGIGLHTGEHVRMAIKPAPAGSGVTFVRTDVGDRDDRMPVAADAVVRTQLGTVLGNADGVSVSTIEHLMAALCALDIDNVTIELDGPEVPITDGSALPFVRLLDRAGRRVQGAARRYIEVLSRVDVVDGDKRASLLPDDGFVVDFEIAFPSAAIGTQRIEVAVDEASFREELADCRTFGFLRDVEALRAKGLALGGTVLNAVVVDGDRVLNPEGLRRPDEFVRHKALDAVGDLYALGAPLLARFEGVRAGHDMNNRVCRALLEQPGAWRWRTFEAEAARRA